MMILCRLGEVVAYVLHGSSCDEWLLLDEKDSSVGLEGERKSALGMYYNRSRVLTKSMS